MKHLDHLVQELSKCPACLLPFQVVGWDNDNEIDNDNNDDNDNKLDDDDQHNNGDSSDNSNNNNNKHHRRHHQISPPLRLPSRSRSCHHRICQPCILQIQVLQWQNNDNVQNEYSHHHHHHNNPFRRRTRSHRHRNATLPCPKCSSPKSFLVNRPPPIDTELTVALECLAPPSSSSSLSSALSLSSLSFRRNRNHHHHYSYSYSYSYVSNVKQHCHEQPWRLPLGTFPHVLEKIANWKSIPLAVDTVREILQGGLLQVHDFSNK